MLIWLGLVLTEPVSIDNCPMHGSHAMHGVATDHIGHHSASHGGAPKKGANQCTCIGDCSAASVPAAVPAATVTVPESRIAATGETFSGDATKFSSALRDHLLPPANGPPSIS